MIEHDANEHTFRCFKCFRWRAPKEFTYTGKAQSDEELADWASRGHAWSCEGCFMRSTFSSVILDKHDEILRRRPHPEFPEVPWDDTIKCIKCQDWLPASFFTCYGNWWRLHNQGSGSGEDEDTVNMDALQAFTRQRCLIWGCNNCFAESQLCAYKNEQTGKWASRYRPAVSNAPRKIVKKRKGGKKKKKAKVAAR